MKSLQESFPNIVNRIKKAFPKLESGWFEILLERVIANNFTKEILEEAVNNVIDICQYSEPTIAMILSYKKSNKVYTYEELLEISKDYTPEQRKKFFANYYKPDKSKDEWYYDPDRKEVKSEIKSEANSETELETKLEDKPEQQSKQSKEPLKSKLDLIKAVYGYEPDIENLCKKIGLNDEASERNLAEIKKETKLKTVIENKTENKTESKTENKIETSKSSNPDEVILHNISDDENQWSDEIRNKKLDDLKEMYYNFLLVRNDSFVEDYFYKYGFRKTSQKILEIFNQKIYENK